jgi:hypothetical protein
VGRDSSVGITAHYGLYSPGIESRWSDIFRTRPDWPWVPQSLMYNGYRVILVGKVAGVWRWQPVPSSAEIKRRLELYVYVLPLWGFLACYRVNFTIKFYVHMYIKEFCDLKTNYV